MARKKKTGKMALKCHRCGVAFERVPEGRSYVSQEEEITGPVMVTWNVIGECPRCGYQHAQAGETVPCKQYWSGVVESGSVKIYKGGGCGA